MPRGRLHQLVIPIAALIPILPLILHGCSCGHDFDFHLLNWLEAARQFTHGNLHPQWAFTPAFNAGEPRFVFYPPISWTLGAILGLIFPWSWTPILYTWIVLTAAGFSLHRLARAFASPTAALLAAVVYLANPYLLFTAYERTAYAELLAAIWIPLLLLAILRERVTILGIAIPIALLWLTNAPAAVMSCYALALLTAVRLATNPGAPHLASKMWASRASATVLTHPGTPTSSRLKLALTTLTGTLLGLALAAFYLVPAAYERRYVQIAMAILPGLRIQDNTLFHRTASTITNPTLLPDAILHDQVLHTASVIAILLLTLTLLALIAAARVVASLCLARDKSQERPKEKVVILSEGAAEAEGPAVAFSSIDYNPGTPEPALNLPKGLASKTSASLNARLLIPLAILTFTILILLTPISLPLWNHLPELAFLQFPWRLLAILAAALCLTLAIAFSRIRLNPIATTAIALAIATAVTLPAYHLFHQPCDPEDTVAARVALFHSNLGTDPTDEYTPITADNDAIAHSNPPYWLSPNPTSQAAASTTPGPAPFNLTLNSPIPQTLILNLRDYPAWRVTLNNTIPTHQPRSDGLIAISIPAGTSQIRITYITLLDRIIGVLVTVIALTFASLLILRDPRDA